MITRIPHPDSFKEGTRLVMLTLRNKEGGTSNRPDLRAKKRITRSAEEFDEAVNEMLSIKNGAERIYASIEPRDIEKGIRIFKERQLEADYYDPDSKHFFYIDVYNRWVSALSAPSARIGTLFLVDIDETDNTIGEEQIRKEIAENGLVVVDDYPTKNGRHIILEPFNPNIVSFKVQKNALMLWAY